MGVLDSENNFGRKIGKGLQAVGLANKKIDRVDVMDALNLHRYSRNNFEFDDDKKHPIAFKQKICDEAINAVKRSNHLVGDYFNKVTLPNQNDITLTASDKNLINLTMKAASDKTKIEEMIENFEQEVKAANIVVKDRNSSNRFAAENYRDLLFNHHAVIETELKKQHKEELTNLNALGNNTQFQLGLPATDRTALVKQMAETLQAKHKEELDKFNKKLSEELTRLMNIKTADISRLALLGILAKSAENEKMLQEAQRKSGKSLPVAKGVTFTASTTNASLFGIDPTKIEQFKTLSDKTVTQQGANFSVKSNRFGSKLTKADLLVCALGVKAVLDARQPPIPQEKQTLKADVTHSNPEMAKKLGKKAFEAALEAGFLEANITVTINGGEKVSAQQLGVIGVGAMTATYQDVEGNHEFKEAVKQLRQPKTSSPAGTTVSAPPTNGGNVTTISGVTHQGTTIGGNR